MWSYVNSYKCVSVSINSWNGIALVLLINVLQYIIPFRFRNAFADLLIEFFNGR